MKRKTNANPNLAALLGIWGRLTNLASVSKTQLATVAAASTVAAFSELFTIALIQPVISMFSGANINREELFFLQAELVKSLEAMDSRERIVTILSLLVLLQILRELFLYLAEFQSIRIRTRFELSLREVNYSKILRIPINKFLSLSSGDTHSLINSYPRSAAGFVFSFISMIPTIIMLAVYIVMMINVEWQLFLLVGFISIFIMISMKVAYSLQTKYGKLMKDGLIATSTKANELIFALPVIRSFGQERRALGSYMTIARDFLRANALSAYLNSALGPLQRALSFVLILGAMVAYYSFNEIDELDFLSTLILFMFILTRINGPLTALNMQRAGLSQLYPTIDELLGFHATSDERTGGLSHGKMHTIEFKDVGFSYSNHDVTLKNLNVCINKGEFIGLVGPSGAGKTTLVNLLSSFEEPTHGEILIDQQNLATLDLNDWRRKISIVPQKPYLFDLSIKENIRYGKPEATDKEVHAAAEKANAADFIEALPDKYDSGVGENGSLLSGGQIQRLAIARALLNEPEILVLDEATSAQDTKSESKIKDTIEKLRGHITIVVIAHRLSTIVNADSILVLESGEIVEQGNHKQLLTQNGLYQKLYALSVQQDSSS